MVLREYLEALLELFAPQQARQTRILYPRQRVCTMLAFRAGNHKEIQSKRSTSVLMGPSCVELGAFIASFLHLETGWKDRYTLSSSSPQLVSQMLHRAFCFPSCICDLPDISPIFGFRSKGSQTGASLAPWALHQAIPSDFASEKCLLGNSNFYLLWL